MAVPAERGCCHKYEGTTMQIDAVSRIKACVDVVSSDLGDGVALFDMRSSTYFNLNTAGGYIWSFISEPRTVDEVINHITAVFEIDRAIAAEDVSSLVAALAESRLLSVEQASEIC